MPVLFFVRRGSDQGDAATEESFPTPETAFGMAIFVFGAQSAAALGPANEFFQALSYVGVFEEITFFSGSHTFRDLAQKPFVVIHETGDGFLDEGWHVAALLSGKSV